MPPDDDGGRSSCNRAATIQIPKAGRSWKYAEYGVGTLPLCQAEMGLKSDGMMIGQ